ncbi:MAG TPA: hypothetical protein VHE55_15990 [Fimbriimonadaceae bacterium]|nr:hypothetical protein [Fimbriimonadaceae bacterium]
MLSSVPPETVRALAKRIVQRSLSDLPKEDHILLAKIGACRFATELYLQAKADALGKRLVLTENGVPLPDVPIE